MLIFPLHSRIAGGKIDCFRTSRIVLPHRCSPGLVAALRPGQDRAGRQGRRLLLPFSEQTHVLKEVLQKVPKGKKQASNLSI